MKCPRCHADAFRLGLGLFEACPSCSKELVLAGSMQATCIDGCIGLLATAWSCNEGWHGVVVSEASRQILEEKRRAANVVQTTLPGGGP